MARTITLLLLALLLAGCNRQSDNKAGAGQAASPEAAAQPVELPRKRVLAAFSGTQTDPWTAALIGALGSELQFDPWEIGDADDYFDYLGPYDLKHGDLPLDLKVVLTGMDNVAGLERQQAATQHLLAVVEEWQPDLLWLDGDQLQYSAGRQLLEAGCQIAFSGLQYDSSMYYEAEDNAAGFYRRHSVSGTMGRIWRDNPDAKFHCIVTDDSPEGRRRLVDFTEFEDLMGEGSSLHVLPVYDSWQELADAIEELPAEADDLIICGAGLPGSGDALTEVAPPEDLLAFCGIPVYVLGPSPLDMLGCTSLSVSPSAQVHEMMTVFNANLGKDIPMSAIPTIVPEEMQLRISESAEVLPRGDG